MSEIMIVVIILGGMSSFALVNYSKVMERSNCDRAKQNIRRMHSAAQIYYIKSGGGGPPAVGTIAEINSSLKINLADDSHFDYQTYYDPGFGPIRLGAKAIRSGGPAYSCVAEYGMHLSATNPSCTSETYCPSDSIF